MATDRDLQEIAGAAEAILTLYSDESIRSALQTFSWRKAQYSDSIASRSALETQLRSAVSQGGDTELEMAIGDIYFWGFGRRRPSVSSGEWLDATKRLVRGFASEFSDSATKVVLLKDCLSLSGIKIATVSKWVCFCDQSQYAIYDSRVSIALRSIVDGTGKRLFPTVGRRQTKDSNYPNGDLVSPSVMTSKYFFYLDVLKEIGKRTNLTPSQIEMALFMLGK